MLVHKLFGPVLRRIAVISRVHSVQGRRAYGHVQYHKYKDEVGRHLSDHHRYALYNLAHPWIDYLDPEQRQYAPEQAVGKVYPSVDIETHVAVVPEYTSEELFSKI